jgi:hypothetical protein
MSNVHQLLIRKSLRNGGGILGVAHSQSRQMIRHHIFGTLFIPNFNVELLKKQNLPDKMRFSIFLRFSTDLEDLDHLEFSEMHINPGEF